MARPDEVLQQLERLIYAYPERELSAETASLYVTELSDIPLRWLARAVREWIHTQPWFPKISELRQTALRLAGAGDFASLDGQNETLTAKYQRLCLRFWRELELDEGEWLGLAQEFEGEDRPHMAARARQRLEDFRRMLAEAG